jgi:hypothetical protein
MIKRAVAGIEEQMEQRVGVGLLRSSAHLDREQEQTQECQSTDETEHPSGIAKGSQAGTRGVMRRVSHFPY